MAALPHYTLRLREFAAHVTAAILEANQADGADEDSLAARATSLNDLSVRLGELGRHEDGLAASQEAVTVYRRLAEQHPDTYLPNLAGALSYLSVHLGELGRHEDGLAASQEAVTVYRRLAEQHPELPPPLRSLLIMV